jgi:hypothetical protein
MGENHPMFGKTRSKETRILMSLAQKGIPKSQTHIENMSKKVYVYSSSPPTVLIDSFISRVDAAKHYGCSTSTIYYYIDKQKVFKDKYILSSSKLDSSK